MVGVAVIPVGLYAAIKVGTWSALRYDAPWLGMLLALAIWGASWLFVAYWYE